MTGRRQESLARCARCGTRRRLSRLAAGACDDGLCARLLPLVEGVAARHVGWWLRRFPAARALREDLLQEAFLAGWQARGDYDEGRAALGTFLWLRMRSAVRGVLLRAWRPQGPSSLAPFPATELPTLLAQCARQLVGAWLERGVGARDARALAGLEAGHSLREVDDALGLSRQRIHQLAARWRGTP